jgi:hypothetical protein
MLLRRRLALALALTGALLLPALPALADGGGWRGHRGHDRHDRHHHGHHAKHHGGHHGHHRHHHGHGGHGPRIVVKNHYRGYPVHHYDYGHAPAFYCGPCSHHFGSYDALSHHVHHHHHIAAIALPSVIFQASIGGGVGWVFDH